VNFRWIHSCAHGNFEEQNRVLESSLIIINAYNNYIVSLMHSIIIIIIIIIIIFLIKASMRNAINKKIWK